MPARYLAIACALGGLTAFPAGQAVAQDRIAIPLTVQSGRPLLDNVYINGRGPFRFLIDTGSTVNVFSPKVMGAAALTPSFQTDLRSATGATPVSGGGGVTIVVGPVSAVDQPFVTGNLQALDHLSSGVQGVLGQAFLAGLDYLLDLRHRRLEIGARRSEPPNGTRTTLRLIGGRPAVATSLGWMIIDSGADLPVMFGVSARDRLLSRTSGELLNATGWHAVSVLPAAPLVIEGEHFWMGDTVALPHAIEFDASGLLPASVFGAVYISNSEGYLVLFR